MLKIVLSGFDIILKYRFVFVTSNFCIFQQKNMLTVNFKKDNDSINLYPPNLVLKVYPVDLYRQMCVPPNTGYMVLDNTVLKKSQIIWILLNGKSPTPFLSTNIVHLILRMDFKYPKAPLCSSW